METKDQFGQCKFNLRSSKLDWLIVVSGKRKFPNLLLINWGLTLIDAGDQLTIELMRHAGRSNLSVDADYRANARTYHGDYCFQYECLGVVDTDLTSLAKTNPYLQARHKTQDTISY